MSATSKSSSSATHSSARSARRYTESAPARLSLSSEAEATRSPSPSPSTASSGRATSKRKASDGEVESASKHSRRSVEQSSPREHRSPKSGSESDARHTSPTQSTASSSTAASKRKPRDSDAESASKRSRQSVEQASPNASEQPSSPEAEAAAAEPEDAQAYRTHEAGNDEGPSYGSPEDAARDLDPSGYVTEDAEAPSSPTEEEIDLGAAFLNDPWVLKHELFEDNRFYHREVAPVTSEPYLEGPPPFRTELDYGPDALNPLIGVRDGNFFRVSGDLPRPPFHHDSVRSMKEEEDEFERQRGIVRTLNRLLRERGSGTGPLVERGLPAAGPDAARGYNLDGTSYYDRLHEDLPEGQVIGWGECVDGYRVRRRRH